MMSTFHAMNKIQSVPLVTIIQVDLGSSHWYTSVGFELVGSKGRKFALQTLYFVDKGRARTLSFEDCEVWCLIHK